MTPSHACENPVPGAEPAATMALMHEPHTSPGTWPPMRVLVHNPVPVSGWPWRRVLSCPSCGHRRGLMAERPWQDSTHTLDGPITTCGPIILECECMHRWPAAFEVRWNTLVLAAPVRIRAYRMCQRGGLVFLGAAGWTTAVHPWLLASVLAWCLLSVLYLVHAVHRDYLVPYTDPYALRRTLHEGSYAIRMLLWVLYWLLVGAVIGMCADLLPTYP